LTPPVLRAQAVARRFGPRVALDALDLEVAGGEALALFGGNGAGKSTLLKLAAGLLRPTGGSIRVDGGRASIGYLGHRTLLYDDLTPLENVRFTATLYGLADPARRAREVLEAMGLSDRLDEPVRTLSRGLAQRVALARALVHAPALLLLDEPTTGLDGEAAAIVVREVRAAIARGAAAIVATHDVPAGLATAGRWLKLTRGRVAGRGDASRGERP
jgi:heme exporter protein A